MIVGSGSSDSSASERNLGEITGFSQVCDFRLACVYIFIVDTSGRENR